MPSEPLQIDSSLSELVTLIESGSPLVSAIIDMIPADIVIFSPEHKYLYVNKHAISNPERRKLIIGMDDYEFCALTNKPISLAENRRYYFNKCKAEKVPFQFEETIVTPHGTEYRIRAMNPICDESGNLLFVVGYGFNDNRRAKLETMLNDLKSALDASADGIAVLDTAGKYTYMNRSHASIFGYDHPDELIGKSWHIIYDNEEQENIEKNYFPELMLNGYWHGATRGMHKCGHNVYQDITLTSLNDGGLICITRDQTEIRKILYDTKRLAVIAEKTKSMVMICNTHGDIEWINQSFYNNTGYSYHDIPKPNLATLFDFDGNLQPEFNQLQSVLKQKGEWQGKVRLNKKDGTRIWMLLNITVIYDNERHIKSYVCIQLDFNDLHELELRLYDSNMKEKHLNQIKSKFINVTSHEIRTPLANIELSTELIRMSLHNEERVLKNLTKISHQVKNITNIMDDFLILSKIELGSVEINQKPVDLTACIKEVINEKIAINDEKRIMITEKGKPKPLYTDVKLLQIIIKNIVENAVKYSPNKKKISIDIEYKEDMQCFSVTDYGIGIPKDAQDKLFHSFYRAPNVEFIKGSGLGLTIVKEFLDLLNGSISFVSEVNSFTTFTICFPKHDEDPNHRR